jgi:hypothetical protein
MHEYGSEFRVMVAEHWLAGWLAGWQGCGQAKQVCKHVVTGVLIGNAFLTRSSILGIDKS